MDKLKDRLKSSAIVLASSEGEKVSLIAGVSPDLIAKVKAGELVNLSPRRWRQGGGRADMAQAGTDPKGLRKALESVKGGSRSVVVPRGEAVTLSLDRSSSS